MQHKAIIYIKMKKCRKNSLESDEEEAVSEETFALA